MSGMVVLIDTNIILDHLIFRAPYGDAAGTVFQYCFQRKCSGYVAAHSITNIFYILRKQFSAVERKKLLPGLCDFIEVAGVQKLQLIDALNSEAFDDLEDCLQTECAKTINADYIITRNINDFTASSIPVVLPEDFLEMMKVNKTEQEKF
jgi:predicted nucleic acid-binding protein